MKNEVDNVTIINYLDIHFLYGPSRVIVPNLLREPHHQNFSSIIIFSSFCSTANRTTFLKLGTILHFCPLTQKKKKKKLHSANYVKFEPPVCFHMQLRYVGKFLLLLVNITRHTTPCLPCDSKITGVCYWSKNRAENDFERP